MSATITPQTITVTCYVCDGHGCYLDRLGRFETCHECHGKGRWVRVVRPPALTASHVAAMIATGHAHELRY